MNLPQGIRPHLAAGIVPVVERTLGEDFSRLRQILYLKVTSGGKVYALPIKTDPQANEFKNALNTDVDEGERQQVLHLAAHLCLYIHTNQENLKLIALYHEPNSPEEPLLRAAVDFVNEQCQQESSETLGKIVLEELVVVAG